MNYTESQRLERAEQAKQLLGSDFFAEMLTEVRLEALNALAEVAPTDIDAIHRQQAIVRVTGEIRTKMEATITATGENDGGYSMTDSSQED